MLGIDSCDGLPVLQMGLNICGCSDVQVWQKSALVMLTTAYGSTARKTQARLPVGCCFTDT